MARSRPIPRGYKAKDLVGLPWMVAHALRADGWYLQADIIWEKPNAMPEKVKDRPTRSHEYVFLLTKSAKYNYDADAIKEEAADGGFRNRRSIWRIAQQGFDGAHFAVFPEKIT